MSKYFRYVQRQGDGFQSIYVGARGDPMTHLLKRRQRLTRAEVRAHRRQHRADQKMLGEVDYCLNACCGQLNAALRAWLRTQSISTSRDGSWVCRTLRQSRGESVPVNMSKDDFEELLALAESGNERAIKSLRTIMSKDRETWFPFGDLTSHARKQLLSSLTRGNTIATQSLDINMAEMREQLRGDHENPIRDLAIDQVITCWVDVHRQTIVCGEYDESRAATNYNDQRLAKTQKRYRDALKFLNDMNIQLGLSESSIDQVKEERSQATTAVDDAIESDPEIAAVMAELDRILFPGR